MYEDATREKAPTPPPPDPPETHEEEFSAHTQVADFKTVLGIQNDFFGSGSYFSVGFGSYMIFLT
jgi:hypothetical protein